MLHRYISLAFFPIFLFTLSFAAISPVNAADPDFSTVNDILQGRRTLLPEDDLIVTQTGVLEPTTTTILQTSGDAVGTRIPYTANSSSFSFVTASARMFNLPNDVVVTVSDFETTLHDQVTGFNQNFANPGALLPALNVYAVADFTGNGYADIVFIDAEAFPPALVPVAAADINDETKGLFISGTGNPTTLPLGSTGPFALAAGDFYGDGHNEIAVAYTSGNNIVVAVYKPNASTDSNGNVTSLTFELAGATSGIPFSAGSLALTAGAYGGLANAQPVLVYTRGSQTEVQPITATPTQVTFNTAQRFTLAQNSSSGIFAQSGYLDFFSNSEQVVLEVEGNGTVILNVLTLDSGLNVKLASSSTVLLNFITNGIALGNFDQSITGSNPVNLEIAQLSSNSIQCSSSTYIPKVQIYHVDPTNNFALSEGNSGQVGSNCYNSAQISYLGLATGDTQGRSLKLGALTKLTVSRYKQPQLILGAPPMHVDFVAPANSSTPVVLNLSAVPAGFFSTYQTKVTGQVQSSQQGATSYANAVTSSTSAGISFGDPLVGSITAKVGANAGFMNKNFVQKQYSQYSSVSFDASTNTGFDDQVWFAREYHYIYIFPIVGQVECPAENPTCSSNDKLPLAIMFSGPSQRTQWSLAGGVLEWYQPVHEVGNIFSYPLDLAQLEADEGAIDLLTSNNPISFSTDGSTHTATATWSGQNQSSVTSGSTSNITWGTSASITEKAGIFGGIVGSQNFSYNGSKSQSALNTQTTKLGEATGIGIVKPGTFPNPDLYQYPIFPYIFGDQPVEGAAQTIDLGTTVQTHGILRSAFTVDPTSGDGAWWQQAYTLPDVAVAHPARWNIQLQTPTTQQPNCIPVSSSSRNQDCASFRTPQSDIWTSEFHWMKGLMITPADTPGEGPQIDSTSVGTQINLQARIYNDSLTDTNATCPGSGCPIYVRFYAEPWDPHTLVSAGNAFLIDEVQLAYLPGFNSATFSDTNPNWALVSTTLDTTNYPDQYLAFWILVYIKDANGNLVPEMTGHGLTSVPPALNHISDATQYLQPESNNIGFYKSLFYVKPPSAPATVDPTQAGLTMDTVEVSASRVLLGQEVTISGLVHSQGEIDGMSIMFFDGDPNKGGKLFDVDGIPHIRASDSHLAKTVYHADSCGEHKLFLQGMDAPFGGNATVRVTIDVNSSLDQLSQLIQVISPRQRNELLEQLLQARGAFSKNRQGPGIYALQALEKSVGFLRGKQISTDLADSILAVIDGIFPCVGDEGVEYQQAAARR
jgi:hypothetical protein